MKYLVSYDVKYLGMPRCEGVKGEKIYECKTEEDCEKEFFYDFIYQRITNYAWHEIKLLTEEK